MNGSVIKIFKTQFPSIKTTDPIPPLTMFSENAANDTITSHPLYPEVAEWFATATIDIDGNDIQASGTDWTAHGAVTKAHARYLYLHQDSAPIDPLIALFRDSNR